MARLLLLTLAALLAACSAPAPEATTTSNATPETTIESGPDSEAVVTNSDAEITITGNGTKQTRACAGQDVEVTGDANEVTFTGTCAGATITGNGNQVRLDGVAAISVLGDNNVVTWRGATRPSISKVGEQNRIAQAE